MNMVKITFRSATEAFLQMEDELDLFDQQIGGVYFWERIRFPLSQQILQYTGVIGQPHTKLKHTLTNRGRSAFRSLQNLFVKNSYLAPKSDILFFGSPRRKLRADGKWWDIYCDPIIEHLGKSYVYLESAYLNSHLTPAKTKNIRYLDFPLYLAAAKRKFGVTKVSLTHSETTLLKNVQGEIAGRFHVAIDLNEMVKRDLLYRKSVLPTYQALLRRIGPKLAFVVCSYGKETFIEACKSMEIPVVELQHGVISPYHLGYSFPGPKRTKRAFPDYLFSFGDFWKLGVEYPITKDRIYSVGYPYLEDEAKQYARFEKKDQILFISQGTIGREMSKLAVQLSTRDNFPLKIVYKLHPGEYARWRKEYPWLAKADIQVVDDDQIQLYKLFAESRAQVGVNSTALFEGLVFGLQTVLLDLPGVEYMEQLVKEHAAEVVATPEELVESILKKSARKIQTERFFKPDSLNNIKHAIDECLSLGINMG